MICCHHLCIFERYCGDLEMQKEERGSTPSSLTVQVEGKHNQQTGDVRYLQGKSHKESMLQMTLQSTWQLEGVSCSAQTKFGFGQLQL